MEDMTNGIETERLNIRRFSGSDIDGFVLLIRDKMSAEYWEYDDQFPTDIGSLKGILSYFSSTDEFYAVVLKSENKLIGYLTLNRESEGTRNLGYCIHSSYRSNGYGTEAVRAIVAYTRDIQGTKTLVSGTAEINVPSVKLLKGMGFVCTGSGEGSFAKDESGNPIVFKGVSFSLTL